MGDQRAQAEGAACLESSLAEANQRPTLAAPVATAAMNGL